MNQKEEFKEEKEEIKRRKEERREVKEEEERFYLNLNDFSSSFQFESFLDYNYNDYNLTYRSINNNSPSFININSNITPNSSSFLLAPLSSISSFSSTIKTIEKNEITVNQKNEKNNNNQRVFLNEISIPKVPFYVGYSNFQVKKNIYELIEEVENCLNQIIELDYQFINQFCKWDIIYLRGSSCCHFEISIFDESESDFDNPKYLLEGNRLSGDGLAFRLVFNQLKESLTILPSTQLKSSYPISPYLQSLPVPSLSSPSQQQQQKDRSVNIPSIKSQPIISLATLCTSIKPSFDMTSPEADDEFKQYLTPILSMIDPSSPIDIQIEGIKILCDLTMSIELHRLLVDSNCIEKLIEILTKESNLENERERFQEFGENDEFNNDNNNNNSYQYNEKKNHHDQSYHCHYVLYAIANMSTYRPCQNILVSNDEFLAYLLSKITNGTHITAEMRRECARTLANLCVGLAPKIIRTLGRQFTTNWIESIDDLQDERLKLHAERAKMYIQNCF